MNDQDKIENLTDQEKIENLTWWYYHFCEPCIFNFDGCSWDRAKKCQWEREKILKRIKELQESNK